MEKFQRYSEEIKPIITTGISEGISKELITKINSYEILLGIKNNTLDYTDGSNTSDGDNTDGSNTSDGNTINIRNTLLKYLDYLDYYIMNHFLVNIYGFNTNFMEKIEMTLDVGIDFVTLLYKKRYPEDKKIDPIKYTQIRDLFEKTYGKI